MTIRNPFSFGLQAELLLTGLLFALALAPATRAATISWTGSNISGPADVSTNGTPVGAMNMDSPTPQTINGVTFVADPGGNNVAMPLGSATVSVSWGVGSFNNNFWAGPAPGGDFNYAAALDFARNDGSLTNGTITLSGLTVGKYYEVQLWIVDTRDCCSNRVRTVDGMLAMNSGAGPHIARGVYKADATTQVINIAADTPGAGPQLNLLQLRSITPNLVLNTNDSGPGSLRQAVADVVSGDTITFTNTLSGGTILLTNGQILVSRSVTLDASALSGGLRIDGNNISRLFEISPGTTNTLRSLTLTGGNVTGSGGAVFNKGALTLDQCTLSDNTASGYGGAIFISSGSVTVNSSTVSGNAALVGGGITIYIGTSATLNSTTVSGNAASGSGGGIFIDDFSTLRLENSVVAGNLSSDIGLAAGGIVETGINLTSGDPLLAPLGNYGGPTQTMPPLPGSPAIDAGLSTTNTPATDQRGFDRVVGGAVDIGAVEGVYNPAGPGTLTGVTKLGDGSVQLVFTNYSGMPYTVFATTNVAQPITNWTFIGSATELPPGSGQFQFTDPDATNYNQRFYSVKSP